MIKKDLPTIKVCAHCGRCVLVGPPCCMESVMERCNKLYSEVQWLRKIQGKQHKRIIELQESITSLNKETI